MNVVRPIAQTEDTVTLSRADFEALLEAVEDVGDAAALERLDAEEARVGREATRLCSVIGQEMLRLIDGESPVRAWREKRVMSLAQLSAWAALPEAHLAECKARRITPDAAALHRLAQALHVGTDDLVARD